MASKSSFSEEDFSCAVCRDIFKEPVLLSCSHSFCRACLQAWWTHKKITECPVCKKISKRKRPPCNRALKNLCEAFAQERQQRASKRQRSEDLCSLHAEKLKLFCLECQQPACVVCRDSKKHTDHSFRPIDEAAQDRKEEVRKSLKPLQEKLIVFNQDKRMCDKAAEHIKVQAENTETQIKEQFKKLHGFLQEEEEAKLTALREEEQQKSQMMKERIERLDREISTVSNTIRSIEEVLSAEHISFLENWKTTTERVQFTLEGPQLVSGALIDVAKHLGNLTFRVWEKMKDIVSYTPVILDPNTAFHTRTLSDDLTCVTRVQQPHPDNPERFDFFDYVLGSEGFKSGTHTWDVEVADSAYWEIGVLAESFQRKGGRGGQYWSLCSFAGAYTARTADSMTDLAWMQIPKKIRVQLDWNKGMLLFSDLDNNTHIHSFTFTFTGTLIPFIETIHTMKILPGKVSVTLE